VDFTNAAWLKSSFPAPETITADHPFSLEVWAYTPKPRGKAVMVCWATRPRSCADFSYGRGGEGAWCSWGTGNTGYSPSPPPAGRWHHIVFTYRPGSFKVYVDGELNVERPYKQLRTKGGCPIYLGTTWFTAKDAQGKLIDKPEFPFEGSLARVRIYDRELSVLEVRNAMGSYQAFAPRPGVDEVLEQRQTTLMWTPGSAEAAKVAVYLGTHRRELEADTPPGGRRKATQKARDSRFGPTPLVLGKTYYWRVDQLDRDGKVTQKGDIWQFTVSTAPAKRPGPRDRTANVKVTRNRLSWQGGKYAVSQNVYFGTDGEAVARSVTPTFKALPASAGSCPIPVKLEYGKVYYWRVAHDNGPLPSGEGELWRFRVEDEPVANDVTFFVTSDSHYNQTETIIRSCRRTIAEMNWLPGTPYPAGMGGNVRTPRGVLVCGDLTDSGGDGEKGPHQWREFTRDFGVNGEGQVAYPVYETFGNHDGRTGTTVRMGIRQRNKLRPGLNHISPNGLHYAWDWDHVRFVCLGLFAGHDQKDVTLAPPAHDPELSLDFLKEDLRRFVGDSGRPVVLFQHYGWDGFSTGWGWWTEKARENLHKVIKDYNVIVIFNGHNHGTSVLDFHGIPVYSAGAAQRGERPGDFWVARVTGKELTLVHRQLGKWGAKRQKAIQCPSAALK